MSFHPRLRTWSLACLSALALATPEVALASAITSNSLILEYSHSAVQTNLFGWAGPVVTGDATRQVVFDPNDRTPTYTFTLDPIDLIANPGDAFYDSSGAGFTQRMANFSGPPSPVPAQNFSPNITGSVKYDLLDLADNPPSDVAFSSFVVRLFLNGIMVFDEGFPVFANDHQAGEIPFDFSAVLIPPGQVLTFSGQLFLEGYVASEEPPQIPPPPPPPPELPRIPSIPEPSTWVMMLLSVCGLGAVLRSTRRPVLTA
jgi:hypothetical protein